MKTLYVDSKIICKNNHWLSEEISLSRGIRQGCPISALLFIIATDVLAEHIKQELRGLSISMNGEMKRIKLAQYADDTILFLRNTDQVSLVTKLLKEFKSVAGLTLNLDKTVALYIADDFENVSTIHGIACNINGAIRCLGVHVGHIQALCDTLNWAIWRTWRWSSTQLALCAHQNVHPGFSNSLIYFLTSRISGRETPVPLSSRACC